MATGTRGAGYGLDAELARKQAAKYDVGLEREAQNWIEAVTGDHFTAPFGEFLKDGKSLCRLINAIQPGSVRRIETSVMPFKQMENIANFLRACKAIGVANHDCFETVDLYELKDLGVVVNLIHALGRKAQTIPGFRGPHLGVREATQNNRKFSKQQLNSGGAVSRLNMGSAGIMDRSAVTTSNDINFGAKAAGGAQYGGGGEVSRLNMGSAGIMDRTAVTTSNDINFGAKAGGASRGYGGGGEVSRLNMGSAGIMDRAPVSRANDINFGANAGGAGRGGGGEVSRLNMGSAGIMDRTTVSRANDITFGRDAGNSGVAAPAASTTPPPPPPRTAAAPAAAAAGGGSRPKFCGDCGKGLPPTGKFCQECGSKIPGV